MKKLTTSTSIMLVFTLFAQMFFSLQARADPQPEYMLAIEYVNKDPAIPTGTFVAKPRKLWRSGTKYMALQEAPDYENGIHGLIITNEPDSYMVNLFNKSAKHIVDPGPSLNVSVPIFHVAKGSALKELEFGNEIEFFTKHSAKKQEEGSLIRYQLEIENSHLTLLIDQQTNSPKMIEQKNAERTVAFEYLLFDNKVKFDPARFVVPIGVTIQRAQQEKRDRHNVKNVWLGDFMNHYYQHPDPARIGASLIAIKEDGMLDSFYSLIGFYAPIMQKNPALLEFWVEAAKDLGADMQQFIYFSLRQCGTDACLAMLIKNPYGFESAGIKTFSNANQPTVETLPLTSPTSLDFLWANFLASGSELPVKRLVKLVGEKWDDFENKKLQAGEALVVAAAHWSLVSNAEQHPIVFEVLKKESQSSTTLKKVLLEVKSTEHKK